MTKQDHSRFVQAVRYSPNGLYFASAGFDGKVFLYDGTSSELIGEIGNPAHKGGVYGVAWKPDSSQLLTCSGDKTCKLWDVSSKNLVTEFQMGTTVDDQQVSCLWQNNHLLSVSLSGFINYLDVNNPNKPLQVIKGHNKPITALALSEDRSTIYTASHDGYVTNWNSGNGTNDRVNGNGHGNQVNSIKAFGDFIYTNGIDDSVKQISVEGNCYTGIEMKLNCQPRGMDILKDKNIIVVGCVNEVVVLNNNQKQSVLPIKYEASCVSINQESNEVAIGGDDNKIHIYELNGNNLILKRELEHLGAITDCAYSPNYQYLVVSDVNRKVILYKLPEYEVSMFVHLITIFINYFILIFKLAVKQEWGFHNARVNCVAWSPNSTFVASGSLDTNIIIWSLNSPSKHNIIKSKYM